MLLLTPLAAAVFDALANLMLFAILSTDCEDCGFDNLGLLLFGGVALAIGAGVVFTLIKMRVKDKNPQPASISISPKQNH
jgi:hypothetical protein